MKHSLSFGLTHVAALLWFAGVVVFIKGEVDRPWLALGLFAAVGAVLFVAGRLIGRWAP